jgi:iron(III) transport system substrate-binding protein
MTSSTIIRQHLIPLCWALGLALWAGNSAAQTSLTLYTAGPAPLAKSLAEGFEKTSGIKVQVFQATTGQIMARLEAERANPQADVLISASWDTAVDLKARGDLMPYSSAQAATVPSALKDSHYVAQGAAALAIVWNPASGKSRPTDWRDLASAEYAQALTMPDPSTSGSAFGLVSSLLASPGYGWKYFESLKAMGITVPGANAQALNPVMQGAKAAVVGAVDYIALTAKAKGEKIEVIYPASGTVLEARPAMILKSARNVTGAQRFIDYMLSPEGQALVAKTLLIPARTDIPALRPGWNDIKVLPEVAQDEPTRAATLAKFKSTMGIK